MPSRQLPPGQQLAARGKWPVVGERRALPVEGPWTVEICGAVEAARTWTLDELQNLPTVERVVDIHCVTRWSLLDVPLQGILLQTLLDCVRPQARARFISFVAHTERQHSTSLPLDEALALDSLVVWSAYGKPLSEEHGGPLRCVVPGKYFYKSVKWLRRIELLEEDRLGYWEREAGYHNGADPWKEERFAASGVTRQQMRRLVESRDWSGQTLLAVQAAGWELAGLVARNAALRAADFRTACLRDADFGGANLSNGRFEDADLRGASFRDADIEGCDFSGADLRGADLRALSMLGVTFVAGAKQASFDERTRFPLELITQLADNQAGFVRHQLGNKEGTAGGEG